MIAIVTLCPKYCKLPESHYHYPMMYAVFKMMLSFPAGPPAPAVQKGRSQIADLAWLGNLIGVV